MASLRKLTRFRIVRGAWLGGRRGDGAGPVLPRSSLFGRVAISNAAVVILACLLVGAILAPRGFTRFALDESLVLAGTLILLCVVNFLVLRSVFAPLERLRRLAAEVDLSHPEQRLELQAATSDVAGLVEAINAMLSRLERAQRERARVAIVAQEEERRRIALELHDEVGQTLTAVLLGLAHLSNRAPADLRADVERVRELARANLNDVRRIALELRPQSLDSLGLSSALAALCDRLSASTDVAITRRIEAGPSGLSPEQELGVYRVAQEALTNLVRHSGADIAHVSLATDGGRVHLEVADEGRGFGESVPGIGLRGMRERAELIGASLAIGQAARGGVMIQLHLDPQDGHG